MEGPDVAPKLSTNHDGDVTLAASSGTNDGDSEYFKLTRNLPMSSANMLELVGHTREKEIMHKVSEEYIDKIVKSTVLITQTDELNSMELSNA